MAKKLYFRISEDGDDVTIEASGFVGTECDDATLPYEAQLGEVKTKAPKPERLVNSQEEQRHARY